MKIVSILSQNEIICPILFHDACDFTYYLLDNEKIKNDENKCNIISNKLYNFRYLIPFLLNDTNEFYEACQIADSYGDRTLERNKPININNMNSNIMNE